MNSSWVEKSNDKKDVWVIWTHYGFYEEEIDNFTQQKNGDVAISSSSHAISRDDTMGK